MLSRPAAVLIFATLAAAAAPIAQSRPPQARQLTVNGVGLSYVEQGSGAPVVFVHGAVADLRFWEPQREAFAKQHRFIAYTFRYHSTAPWPDDGKQYSAATHVADLAAFIEGLKAGPVHLVGLSYGGLLAAIVTTKHPRLIKSLTLAEPGLFSVLADLPEGKQALDSWNQGPLMAAHGELRRLVASISADAIAAAAEDQLARTGADLQRLDAGALAGGMSEALGRVRALVEALSPDAVLAPLAQAHGDVARRLGELDVTALLEPLGAVRDALDAALEELGDADAQRAAAALEPLRAAAAACDPERAFAAAAAAMAAAAERLAGLALETVLAGVRADRAATLEALSDAAARTRVQALDPLGDADLTRAVADLGRQRAALRGAYASATVPAELAAGYDRVRPVVEAMVPAWAEGTPTAEGLREAFAWADPAAVTGGLAEVQADVVSAWQVLAPSELARPFAELHAQVLEALAAVDPEAVAGRVNEVVGDVAARLAGLDLSPIRDQGGALADEVRGLVDALDPQPIIDRLSSLAGDVRGLVDRLDPAALLAELQGPVDAAREIVGAVDPTAVAQALEPAFARIREILAGIDLRQALQPLLDRLDGLRDELQSALERTERAFRDLLAAIPS